MNGLRFVSLCMCLTVFLNTDARAQLSVWDFGGYAKDLVTYTDGTLGDIPVSYGNWQNTAQVHLNLFWYPSNVVMATAQAQNIITYQKKGSFLFFSPF